MDAFSTKARDVGTDTNPEEMAASIAEVADWVQATSKDALQVLKDKYMVEVYDSLRSKGGEHYRQGAIQPIDFIMSQNLDFPAGNVVKYVTRAGRKEGASAISDLRKAMHYLEFMLEKLEESDDD